MTTEPATGAGRPGGTPVGARRVGTPGKAAAAVVAAVAVFVGGFAVGGWRSNDDPSTGDRTAVEREAPATTVPAPGGPSDGLMGATPASSASAEPPDEAVERARTGYGWGSMQPYGLRFPTSGGVSDGPISPERRALLGQQLQRAREAALRVGTVAEAERLGYRRNHKECYGEPGRDCDWIQGRGYEYINLDLGRNGLDLDRPTMLVFADDEPDSPVIAIAYNVAGSREAGPPDEFPLEIMPWHYHQDLCLRDGSIVVSDDVDYCAQHGGEVHNELDHWMIDLWIIPGWENPWSLVSSQHPDLRPVPWYGEDGFPQAYCTISRRQ